MPMYLCRSHSHLHILDMCLGTYLPRTICTAVFLFDIWSKYDNFTYLMTYFWMCQQICTTCTFSHKSNLKHANKLLKHPWLYLYMSAMKTNQSRLGLANTWPYNSVSHILVPRICSLESLNERNSVHLSLKA